MANKLPVPESEQRVLDNLLRDLNETYPDKVIVRLQQDHKKWYEKVTRLYKNIGYSDRNEFLAAYGFTVEQAKNGRPTDDLNAIIEELIVRYKGDKFVTSVDQLKEENPDLAPKFKSIQNKSKELFGMSFNAYLKEKGVFQSDKSAAEARKEDIKKRVDEILDELKSRYFGKNLPYTLNQLQAENKDIKDIQRIGPWIIDIYDIGSADYLKRIGLLEEDKTSIYEDKLNEAINALKHRYQGRELPQSVSALIRDNPDLGISCITEWIENVYGKSAQKYLAEIGLLVAQDGVIVKDETFKKLTLDEQVERLKQKYAGKLQKPTNLQDLIADNLELPIKAFYKSVQDAKGDAYLYLWDKGILTPFKFRNGMIRHTIPDLYSEHGIKSLRIPDGTVGVLHGSFFDCNGITELHIPDSVKYIGSSSFNSFGLKNLREIRFGKGVKEIGDCLFGAGLENLESIIMNEELEYVNGRLFDSFSFSSEYMGRGLAGLKIISMPSMLKGFAGNIFEGIGRNVEISCPNEIIEAIKQNSENPENDYYLWDEDCNKFIHVEKPSFSDNEKIGQYGIPNDDPFEDVKFFDDINSIKIEGSSFCFSGIPSKKQEEYEYSIRQAGGKAQKEINGKTDYLVINKKAATDRMKYNGVRYRSAIGKLKIINLNTFDTLFKEAGGKPDIEEIIVANKDTFNNAIALYKSIITKLQNAGADSRPILEDIQVTEGFIYVSPKKFEETVLVKHFCGELGLESKDIIHGSPMVGGVGIEYPVAMVVSNAVICGNKSAGEMVFSRDKWEYRNDYSSATRPAFKWSADLNDWQVHKKPGYEQFSNM